MTKSTPTGVKRFVGVDGEAIDGHYVLFAAGDDSIQDPAGLRLDRVLDWLADRAAGARFVGFAFHYDVCMLIRDLPDWWILALMEGKRLPFGHWRVQYFSRRILKATRYGDTYAHLEIFDVWGFFQSSFEAALTKIGLPPSEDIVWGKRNRATFEWRDIDRIREYNRQECLSLATMCAKLEEGMRSQDIRIQSWHGPGALADAVLKRAGMKAEIVHPNRPMLDVFSRAYFGGRIEVLKIGYFPEVTLYDINSAYPAACCELWDQTSAEFERVGRGTRWRASDRWSVWHVEWSVPGIDVGPLPFRASDGRIYFPARGRGWYWQPEVVAARALHPDGVRVLEGYTLRNARPSKLTATVLDLYSRRQALKRDGRHIEAHVVKLALNSLYGKMAQKIGRAPWQAPAWAGYVTSWTRAKLREAVVGHEHAVVGFSTDGVLLDGRLGRLVVERGEGLGAWKEEHGYAGWVLGSGIYRLRRRAGINPESGQENTEAREGIRGGPVDWPDAIAQINGQGYAVLRDTIFVAPHLAIINPRAFGPYRGQWMRRSRTLAPWLDPKAKRGYQFIAILDWNHDHCESTILDGWDEESAPFDAEWRGGPGSMKPGLLLTPSQV